MDPILKKLHQQYTEKSARQSDLIKKGELSADETTELKTLTDEISELAAKTKERNDILKSQAEAEGFFKGQPNMGTKEIEAEPAREHGKKVGTDLIEITLNGKIRQADYDGFALGEKQFNAICEPGYAKAFSMYIRKGLNGMDSFDRKALTEGIDTAGGFWVPPQWIAEVISPDPRESSLTDLVRTVPVSSDKVQFPKWVYAGGDNDSSGDIFTNPMRKKRSGEEGAPATGTEPSMGEQEIGVYEGTLEVPITRSLRDDSAFDVMAWVQDEFSSSFKLDTDRELAVSAGTAGPQGIMFDPGGTNQPPTVNIGNPVTGDGVIDLFYTLPSQYRKNGVFVMEDATVWRTLMKLKGSDNHYIGGIFNAMDEGLAAPRVEKIMNHDVKFNPFFSTGGAAANIIAWGDFRKAYYYALRMGMSFEIQELPRERYVYIVVRFRDGGRMVQPRALRIGKQS